MYGYEPDYVPLNEEEILKRVNQEEIIEMALGYTPIPHQKILNPLKEKDTRPGAYFEWFNGKFMFVDFGDQPTHRIPFRFISDYYKIEFIDGLRLINEHFQLGLGGTRADKVVKPVVYQDTKKQYEQVEKKHRANIVYLDRPLQPRDKSSWFKYGITRSHLMEDKVLAGIWYKIYSEKLQKWVVLRPQDNFYIFSEFSSGHIKIIRPNAPPQHKWITNCDENDIFALPLLPTLGKTCIIQKSYKDCRIIRNHNLSCIGFQNEGCLPKESIIIDLMSRFERFPIFFDNDEAGIKASIKISDYFNSFKPNIAFPLHLPTHLNKEGITDPGDLVLKRSQAELHTFLVEKGLYDTTNNP